MITDPVPRRAPLRAQYAESDRLLTLELPEAVELRPLAGAIEAALADADKAEVQRAANAFAASVARAHGIAAPPVKILGVRPHRVHEGRCTYELFGDYDPGTTQIRLWTRTAMKKQMSAYGAFLSTLCHEVCHHLDVARLGFEDTPHTRGFYERAGLLYHHARDTPRRALVWVDFGAGRYRIDWGRTMKGQRKSELG